MRISAQDISLSALRKMDVNTYMVRLVNNSKACVACDCTVFDKSISLSFGKYEVKTLLYKNGELCEHASMLCL